MKKCGNGEACKTRTISTKMFAVMLSLMLVLGGVIGGTLAWLTNTTSEVTNTFTTSDVKVTLTEPTGEPTGYKYKMVPGWTIEKDPTVTVSADSEDCYVFVKVVETNDFDTFMEYTVADDWTPLMLEGVSNVYYKEIEGDDAKNTSYSILNNDQVTVKNTVTKEEMNALTANTYPKLTFTAYAVQLWKNNTEKFEPIEAWKSISN